MKSTLLIVAALCLFVLGLLFIVLPGPSLLFFVAAFALFSMAVPSFRPRLKWLQQRFREGCVWLDRKLNN